MGLLALIPLPWKIAGLLAVLVALGGAGGWFYMHGRADANNAAIRKTLEETEDARKSREKVEGVERSRNDRDATECLRKPAGC